MRHTSAKRQEGKRVGDMSELDRALSIRRTLNGETKEVEEQQKRACPQCTFLNHIYLTRCEVCDEEFTTTFPLPHTHTTLSPESETQQRTEEEFFICKKLPLLSPLEFAKIIFQQHGDKGSSAEFCREVVRILSDRTIDLSSESGKMQTSASAKVDVPSIADMNTKFLTDKSNFVLAYGEKESFMAGLESYIGRPRTPHILKYMESEHNSPTYATSHTDFSPSNQQFMTTPAEEWLFVMDHVAYRRQAIANGRQIIQRNAIAIEELMRHELCIKAKLNKAEVVAARLYTGPMYELYNRLLRNPPGPGNQAFVYTIHAFASCIVKLSHVHRITTLYRGIKGGVLPKDFVDPDEYGVRGGVDLGFMSTTTAKHVAYDYSGMYNGNAQQAALIYEIDEGAIDRGADVAWLSQFPNENEVVFPPCTNLQVVGEPQYVDGAIVTKLRLNINLRIRTVDEIVAKSRTEFLYMLDWFIEEVRMAAVDSDVDPSQVLPSWMDDLTTFKQSMAQKDGMLFNQHKFYRKAMGDALDLKEGTLQKVRVLKVLNEMDVASLGHHGAMFKKMLAKLRSTNASHFADPLYIMRFVSIEHGSYDKGGNVRLSNYNMLWNLNLESGAWTSLVRSQTRVAPVRVVVQRTLAQLLRDLFDWLPFVTALSTQVVGIVAVDRLLGYDGVYYCIGTNIENGRPFYQLSKEEGSLSCKYIYYKGGRWHVGSVLGSESADLRAMSEGEALPAEVQRWGTTSAPVFRAYLISTIKYYEDTSVCVETVRGHGKRDVEAATMNPIPTDASSSLGVFKIDDEGSVQDGQKWAFVHRLIAAKEKHGEKEGVMISLGKSEVHSIASFCQQSDCQLPGDVNAALLQEGTDATLTGVVGAAAVVLSLAIGGFMYGLLCLSNFGAFALGDFGMGWFLFGWWMGVDLVVVIAVPFILFFLNGPTCVSICGAIFWIGLNMLASFIFYVTTADEEDAPAVRGGVAILVMACGAIAAACALVVLLVR